MAEADINWECTQCGTVVGPRSVQPTLLPALRMGRCWRCNAKRQFRPANKSITDAPKPKPKASDVRGLLAVEQNPVAGERAKEVGMRGAEFAEVPSGWVQAADAEIARLASTGERFTSDTVVAAVGMPAHYNAVGARMNAAARKGIIRKVGYANAGRPSAHARAVAVWQGT